MSACSRDLPRGWLCTSQLLLTLIRTCFTANAPVAAGAEGVAPQPSAIPTGPKRGAELPDEYLPPNKILFVQDLPEGTMKEVVEALFNPSVARPLPSLLHDQRLLAASRGPAQLSSSAQVHRADTDVSLSSSLGCCADIRTCPRCARCRVGARSRSSSLPTSRARPSPRRPSIARANSTCVSPLPSSSTTETGKNCGLASAASV